MWEESVTTERLHLRRFQASDLAALSALIRDKMAGPYAPYDTQWPTDDANMPNILRYFIECDGWYAVIGKDTGALIGFVVVSRENDPSIYQLGYTIHSQYLRRGYAYEACRALMAYHESLAPIARWRAGTADCNEPSIGLLRKLGFTKFHAFPASSMKANNGFGCVFDAGEYERVVTRPRA